MAVFDLFSKRQRRARGEVRDVYQYDALSPEFRVQVIHILTDVFGEPNGFQSQTEEAFKFLHDTLCREYGRLSLSERYKRLESPRIAVFDFLSTAPIDEALDLIELALRLATSLSGDRQFVLCSEPKMKAPAAIAEVNTRFRENGIGFQFESGEIIRVDSQIIHADAVRPALALLGDPEFSGANGEFLKAHEHHRHGRHAESINECLKALESTLKIICTKRKWKYEDTATAKALIDVVFAQGLVPEWLQCHFTALRSTIESGVPTGRNRTSGHGQGVVPRTIPPHFASYVLHLTASAIVFLVKSHKAT